jgi:7-cyano-7-deazaguanine synthase in queuosine biosynthesis
MSARYYVRPKGYKAHDESGESRFVWPLDAGDSKTVRTDIGWTLAPIPGAIPAVLDLVHLAAGAYMADRSTRRGQRFSREISLRVAFYASELWTVDLLAQTQDLLGWLTGDEWTLSVAPAPGIEIPEALGASRSTEPVSLLSGGLDSYLGAIQLLEQGTHPLFVGHKDLSTAIRSAQQRVSTWLGQSYAPTPSYTRIGLTQAIRRKEPSSRSRSLLFLSLGVAVATSNNSGTLVVPENGYTGINLPLRPNRGGALSTRSTHPETFRRVSNLLSALDIDISITNPFEWMTKGEAMSYINSLNPPSGWLDIAAATLSCGKLGGNWFSGSPNLNCGLCVPCLVRRATFLAADIPDGTEYLHEALTGAHLDDLISARRGDIEAVKYAVEAGVDPDAIDAGTWPLDYDLDQAEDLDQRGINELGLLELP